jgi:hypothetical protein
VFLGFLFLMTVSLVRALLNDDGLTVTGRGAAWARNHRLGRVVDLLESWKYSRPPSSKETGELSVVDGDSNSIESDSKAFRPPPLTPVVTNPSSDEGVWKVVRKLRGESVVWTSGFHPSKKFPQMTVSFALIDQKNLTTALYNGTEVPGGRGWKFGNKVDEVDASRLVFAFNGGFRQEHSGGGYYTEGKMIWPLVQGMAALIIDQKGKIDIGVWGVSPGMRLNNLSSFVTVRQNLRPTVIDGQLNPELKNGYWGGGKKGEIFILRSGVCKRTDGRILFAIGAPIDATTLAQAMVHAGCEEGMQLDQNESYPRGYIFEDGKISKLDSRMVGQLDQYLTGSPREFFALFGP